MTSASEDHVARCVALERSYVHEVYEQFHETPRARPWPRINHFLSELEPGSLVCDVGCGNGKYLNINQSVFQVGVDRCSKLCEMAREKENEVLVCDNLSLPFRDESFDAVLSIAVIHHFATTERRVVALRELARLLRIGGRLIISVWAMEQRHRKFESQDVLVPWHRPHRLSTPSLELCTSTTNTSEEDVLPAYHAYTQSDTDSNRSLRRGNNGFRKRGRSRHKGRSIDPNRSSSPSSSSLSSPNETCYSFVRRAIQKLAGGKRGGSRHRPWFLDSWSYCSKEPRYEQRYDPDGCEDCDDVHDLPIELRRIEEDEVLQNKNHPFERSNSDLYKGQKSKSLSDIQTIKQESIIRSRSNVSNLRSLSAQSDETNEKDSENKSSQVASEVTTASNKQRPKLVKQKKSLNEEDGEDLDKPLNQRDLVEALPDFRLMHSHYHRRGNVFKQSSMNEELMSTERLREKERVRKNIQKQASLNEDLIYRRYRTLDSLRDSIFSVSTQKRFQLIKNGFTTKLKNSTTNIEKVTSSSLKNGFVRILQSWKTEAAQSEKNVPSDLAQNDTSQNVQPVVPIVEDKNNELPGERRHSREDGSDSSKDSSLQSDTSVDSEDSFASVIFVPKQESQDLTSPTTLSPVPTSPRVKTTSSGPTSPRLKQSSCPTSPRIKQIPLSVYPLLKTPGSPKTAQQLKQIPAGKVLIYSQSTICNNKNNYTNSTKPVDETSTNNTDSKLNKQDSTSPEDSGIVLDHPKKSEEIIKEISKTIPSSITLPQLKEETLNRYRPLAEKYKIQKIPAFRSARDLTNFKTTFDKTKMDRLKKIREILNQRPGFGKSGSSRSAFPLVRRSSTDTSSGKSELVAKSLPRLLSLELFNPETDDMDSDSSGVSSPDSIESVISVDVDTNKDAPNIVTTSIEEDKIEDSKMTPVKESSLEDEDDFTKLNLLCSTEEKEAPKISPTSMSLLEAAANVANSLDDAVGAVIKSSPRLKRKQLQEIESSKIREIIMPDEYKNSDIRTKEFVAETTQFPFDTLPRNPPIPLEEPTITNYSLIPSSAPAIPPRTSIQPPDSLLSKFAPSNGSIACEPLAVPPRIPSIPMSISSEPLISSASWSRQCYEHLTDFADQISENLLQEIDKYQEESKRRYQHKKKVNVEPIVEKYNDPYIHKLSEEIEDLTRLSEEIDNERKLFYTKYNSDQLLISSVENKRCDSIEERRQSISESAQDKNASETKSEQVLLNKPIKQTHDDDQESVINKSDLNNLISVINNEQGFNQTNIVTKISSRENSNVDIKQLCINSSLDNLSIATTSTVGSSGGSTHLLTGLSQESSDAGDISERTTASSGDYDSRRGNDSTASVGDGTASTASVGDCGSTASVGDCGSTASLSSCTDWTRTRRLADGRSSSEEMPDSRGKRGQLTRQHASVQEEPVTGKTGSASSQDNSGAGGDGTNEELRAASDTSQESLPSDSAGGAITYHRYYHVFREGELDQLIERYVENLHIISSYYDHASWCVVAEKVQVWTI